MKPTKISAILCVSIVLGIGQRLATAQSTPRALAPPSSAATCFAIGGEKLILYAGESLRVLIAVHDVTAAGTLTFSPPSTAPAPQGLAIKVATHSLQLKPGRGGELQLDFWLSGDVPSGRYRLRLPYSFTGAPRCPARGMKVVDLDVRRPDQMSTSELGKVGASLTKRGLDSYAYREFLGDIGKNGRTDFRMVRAEDLQGRLLMRGATALKPLGKNTYHDGQGNPVHFGSLSRRGEVPLPYSVTVFPGGSYALAIDGDRDGFVDIFIGGARNEALWKAKGLLMANGFGMMLMDCLRQGRSISPELLAGLSARNEQAQAGGSVESPCVVGSGHRSRTGRRGGTIRGGFPGDDGLGAANCAPPRRGPPVEPSSDGSTPPKKPIKPDLSPPAAAETTLPTPEESRSRDLDESLREAIAESLPGGGDESGEDGAAGGVVDRVQDAIFGGIEEALGTPFSVTPDVDVLGLLRGNPSHLGIEIRIGPSIRRSGTDMPPVLPDGSPTGDFNDPRCVSTGGSSNLFKHLQSCRVHDMLDCLRRQMDTAYSATGGNCSTEIGSDDRVGLQCRQSEPSSSQSDEAHLGSPGSSTSGPTDAPTRRSRGTRGSSFDPGQDFISLTPLGGVVFAMCKADCGGIPVF